MLTRRLFLRFVLIVTIIDIVMAQIYNQQMVPQQIMQQSDMQQQQQQYNPQMQQQQQYPQQQYPQQQMQQQQMQQQMHQQPEQGSGQMFSLPVGSLQPEIGYGKTSGSRREPKSYSETKYNHFKPEHVSNSCLKQKKILLDVNQAGFGNKLLAIVSSAVLATLMNRVLELDWTAYRDYNSLFNIIQQQPMLEIFRDLNSTSSNTFETVVRECSLKFTPINDYQNFWFLRHPALFQKMDEMCDIIKLTCNSYYAPFLMDPTVFGEKANMLRQIFTDNPLHTIGKCHLQPNPVINQLNMQIINEMRNSGGKWLSIHARAYYDYNGKASSKAFTCAKRLLEVGMIKRVYFATESLNLINLAQGYFQQFPGALYISDKMIQQPNPAGNMTNIDNEINVDEAHVVEWLTIGEADYCISPTFEVSSFSNTGLYRGPCILIPMKAYRDCDLYLQNSQTSIGHPKRLLFSALNNPRAIRTWNKPVDLDKVWSGLVFANATSQCSRDRDPSQISQYWSTQQC